MGKDLGLGVEIKSIEINRRFWLLERAREPGIKFSEGLIEKVDK